MRRFEWEDSRLNILEISNCSDWKWYFGPNLDYNSENVMELTILDSKMLPGSVFVIGLYNRKHRNFVKSSQDPRMDKDFWGISYKETSPIPHFKQSISLNIANVGNVIRVIFNKPILSFSVNKIEIESKFDDLTGSNLCLVVCATRVSELRIAGNFVNLDFDEQERFDYVLENLPNFELPLGNQTLNIWKPFLITSQEDDFLSKMSSQFLSVEEDVILSVFLGSEVFFPGDLPLERFGEYFMFFKIMGLKSEMFFILRVLEQRLVNESSYIHIMNVFREFVLEYEKEEFRNWFLPETKKKVNRYYLTFEHAFSMAVFSSLVNRRDEVKKESTTTTVVLESEEKKEGFKILTRYINKKELNVENNDVERYKSLMMKKVKNNNSHHNNNSSCPFVNTLLTLWETRESSYNLKLKTRIDGCEFKVHREVLCISSNFFFRMVRFGGHESESMNTRNEIILEDLGGRETMAYLELIYTERYTSGQGRSDELDVLLDLFLFLEKFMDKELQERCKREIRDCVENRSTKGMVKNAVKKIGKRLKKNRKAENDLLQIFEKKVGRKVLKKIVSSSAPDMW